MIPTIRQQRQQQPKNEDEVLIQPDEENDSDNNNDDDGDYWQPRANMRRWVPNRRYYGDQYETRTTLDPSMAYATLMHDFGLLTENKAYLAKLGLEELSQKVS